MDPTATREGGLTPEDLAILTFDRAWWTHAGTKDEAIRETFDMSTADYYQRLNALLDQPEALAAAPSLVRRLRRQRLQRQRARAQRRSGTRAS